jgi:SPP1 gp7 family putative phage head morphogenesis protein
MRVIKVEEHLVEKYNLYQDITSEKISLLLKDGSIVRELSLTHGTLITELDIDSKDILDIIPKADPYGRDLVSPLERPNIRNPTQGLQRTAKPKVPVGYPSYLKPIPINTRDVEKVLVNAVKGPEKKIQRFLVSTLNAQRDAIKFEEIRNSISTGQISQKWMDDWKEDYSKLINNELEPEWRELHRKGMTIVSEEVTASFGIPIKFPETAARLESWVATRGAELTVNLSLEQTKAVKNVIKRLGIGEGMGPTEMGRYLRPIIGLTEKEEGAVAKLRQRLIDAGKSDKHIERQVQNYSARLNRARSLRIARTETSFAYNHGSLEGIKQYQEQGLITDPIIKVFRTAEDERVCPFCGPLNNKSVGVDQTFPGLTNRVPNVLVPPVHPNCRCTIIYVVLSPDGKVKALLAFRNY